MTNEEVSTHDEFDFSDLTIQERIVLIKDGKYILREANGAAVAKWRNAQISGSVFADGRMTGGSKLGDLQPLLISACLYDHKTDKLVDRKFVDSLPDRILGQLYDWIMEVSELKKKPDPKKDEETAKNEQGSTTDG